MKLGLIIGDLPRTVVVDDISNSHIRSCYSHHPVVDDRMKVKTRHSSLENSDSGVTCMKNDGK